MDNDSMGEIPQDYVVRVYIQPVTRWTLVFIQPVTRWTLVFASGAWGFPLLIIAIGSFIQGLYFQGTASFLLSSFGLLGFTHFIVPVVKVCKSCGNRMGKGKISGHLAFALNPLNIIPKSIATIDYSCSKCGSTSLRNVQIHSKEFERLNIQI